MAERIQQLLNRVLQWWNAFTTKQKTLIIAVSAGVVMALVIVLTIVNRPDYVLLIDCESTKQAAEVTALLEGQDIIPRVSPDGLRVEVEKEVLSDANMLLGANNIQPAEFSYSLEEVTSGGFSETESDKQREYQRYKEMQLASNIVNSLDAVKEAYVQLNLPENDGTLLQKEVEASAFIMLELEGDFSSDQAATLARGIATALGNKTTQRIDIVDTQSNSLFSGDSTYSLTGNANSQLNIKTQYENRVRNEVRNVLSGINLFTKVEVASNLQIDFSSEDSTRHEYDVPTGQEEGLVVHEETYSANAENGTAGVPGTDSNEEDTSYQFQNAADSSSSEAEEVYDRVVDETITTTTKGPGEVDYAASSVSITGTKYVTVKEEDIRDQGLLDGIDWEEYKRNNQDAVPIPADQLADMYALVANATGIPSENITIVGNTQMMFLDAEGLNFTWQDILAIVVIVIIFLLLGVVTLQVMRSRREEVQEEELSVESLLQSQPELELENISLDEGSEAKKLIDRFVEENPEAAAALLRNWLNEEWA